MDDPNMHAYGEDGPTDAEIGRQWRENSSLEKWFPITAERLAALEAENAALKRDLQYARDGLTKGRTRMREDNERLAREAHTWWTACRDATGEIERLREVAARMVAGIDHLDKLTREWEPDHSSGADRRGWLLAKDARDDAARLLGPNAEVTCRGGADE